MKIKSHPVFFLPVAVILFLTAARSGPDDPFIDFLNDRLNEYHQGFSLERTYLMTDRNVYRPGDNLWFKGFVTTFSNKVHSEDFFIRLLNSQGEEIIYQRYPVNSSETSGHLSIPRSCIPGKYWLIAYTGWMKNRCPEEAFRKEILISRYFEKRFSAEINFDKNSYSIHDTLVANIRIVDASGKPVSETPFDFNIGGLRKIDMKGSGKTDIKGKSKISAVIPETDDILMLTIEIRTRKISGDYSEILPLVPNRPQITFHPEGGNMVTGLKSLIVLKASNSEGIPLVVNGTLTDNSGNEIQKIQTDETGLAEFMFLPGTDTCYFETLGRNGAKYRYRLPRAALYGSVIRYSGIVSDSAQFTISSSLSGLQKTYWTAVFNGRLVFSKTLEFVKEGTMIIPVANLPAGIMQITVFDENRNILAERLVGISEVQADILKVKQERKVFHPRQRVSILVEYPEHLKNTEFALSVSMLNLNENKFSPAFGIQVIPDSCQSEKPELRLDMSDRELITTQKKIINWDFILKRTSDYKDYDPYNGLTGRVVDKKENISPHAKVRVTHFPNLRSFETQTDENGSFHISFGSDIIDYKFLNIDAYDATGKTSLTANIDYEYIKKMEKMIKAENSMDRLQKINDLIKYGEPDLVYVLRFGPGKFRKSHPENRKKFDPYKYAKYTDIMDIIQDIQPYELMNNRIYFLDRTGNRDTSELSESLIVINGALRGNNATALKNILPSDITNINISGSLLDVHKYTPLNFNHVIEITTIQSMYRYRQQHIQMGPGILNAEKSFYSPDYSVESSYSADNRRTLYWNPEIILLEGNSMLVTFYTSDIKGDFIGKIAGIDPQGNPVEAEFIFTVE